ncbi:MAG: copper transporter [Streptosporangiaceae bacterium]
MIDFRYHVVSIVAVFLALAIGLIVGSTTLQDKTLELIRDQANRLQVSNDDLRAQVKASDELRRGEDQFASVIGPQIEESRLRNESVVFVEAPGADSKMRIQLDQAVKNAGGSVTGWVSLTDKFLADDQAETISQLSDSLKAVGTTFADSAGPYEKAGTVLAQSLVTTESAKVGHEEVSSVSALSGFKDGGYLSTSGKPGGRATLAIVIAPSGPYDTKVASQDNKALVALAQALDLAGRGTVAAGNFASVASGDGFLSELRGSSAASTVSSVDTADIPSGQVVTVLALNVELTGKSGKYGIGSGTSGYLPVPLPIVPVIAGRP